MLQKPRTLPRIDLAHHHLTELSLSLTVEWDNDLDDMFGWNDELDDVLNEILGDSLPLVFTYKQRKITYAILVMNSVSPISDGDMQVDIRYIVVPQVAPPLPGHLHGQGDMERALLRHLGHLPMRGPMGVVVEYEFAGVAPADLWYPLPNRVGAPPESPLIDVHGIRGNKLNDAGDGTEFVFTLDRAEDDDGVILLLTFQAVTLFDEHTPLKVLELANTYARLMVHN